MAKAIITFKLMPESPEIDLEPIKIQAQQIAIAEGAVGQTQVKEERFVQVFNPKSHTYVKIDRKEGIILSHHPKKDSPYKNIPIVKK